MADLLAPLLVPFVEPFVVPLTSARSIKGGGLFDRVFGPSKGTMVGLERGPANAIWVWSQVEGGFFLQQRHDNAFATSRPSWRETIVIPTLRKLYPVADLTLSGTWTQLQTSGSGVLAKHAGDRAIAASTNGAYAQCDVTRSKPYDLYVAYTGRTDGAYCRVDIDGSQALVNEIGDPAALGYKAFSSYNAVNQSVRQYIKVASGLTGTHTIRVTKGPAASPGGNTLQIEAIAIDADITDDRIMPKPVVAGEAVTIGDERQNGGRYYCARQSGITGATLPTHSTGIVSDGSIEWSASLYTSYQQQIVISPADSEREYAIEATLSGTTSDIGGQTHGDETPVTRVITVDGAVWSESGAFAVITAGAEIRFDEALTWVHPNDATLASCVLTRILSPSKTKLRLDSTSTAATDTGLGYLYSTMLVAISWDDIFRQRAFDQFMLDNGTMFNLDDYANQVNPNVNCGAIYAAAALGTFGGKRLAYAAKVPKASMKNYENMNAQAFFRPNVTGTDAAGTGVWVFKMYFNRAVSAFKEALPAGGSITIESEHAFRLV